MNRHKISTVTLEQYPLIWGSHNCNTYVKLHGQWHFSDFAKTLDEAKKKTEAFILSKSDKPAA